MAFCFASQKGGTPDEQAADKEINKLLTQEKKKSIYKLLLLGTGESGKSTIAKQMKIIHLNGYTSEEERRRFRPVVFQNIFENTLVLVKAATEQFDWTLSKATQEAIERIQSVNEDTYRSPNYEGFGTQLTQDFNAVWQDPIIQDTFKRSAEFQLNDTTAYFFANLAEIGKTDYIPTQQDIVHVRAKTTGINEIEFKIGTYFFHMTDVGGQRSERRKWIHCFEDVTAILFCVALSEYDQKLYEDGTTNRMSESIRLFSDVSNSKWFSQTSIILFLNKKDIFEEKIQRVPLSVCFDDYTGKNEYEEASDFIKKKFQEQLKNGQRVFAFKTCATDTGNIKRIFASVKQIVLGENMDVMGFSGGVV